VLVAEVAQPLGARPLQELEVLAVIDHPPASVFSKYTLTGKE
jgi:hypothetical protein